MADMNRRNVLLGLGTAAAGSGIVFGSGAFTQVQADRELVVTVEDDSAAVLGIEVSDTGELVDNNPSDTDVAFEIDLDEDFGSVGVDSFLELDGDFTFINNAENENDEIEIELDELDDDGSTIGTTPTEFTASDGEGIVKFVDTNTDLSDGQLTTNDDGDENSGDDAILLDSGTSLTLNEGEDETTNLIIATPEEEGDIDDIEEVRFSVSGGFDDGLE